MATGMNQWHSKLGERGSVKGENPTASAKGTKKSEFLDGTIASFQGVEKNTKSFGKEK